jgi:hypothetical protein
VSARDPVAYLALRPNCVAADGIGVSVQVTYAGPGVLMFTPAGGPSTKRLLTRSVWDVAGLRQID